jgi:hypothetical protein
MLVLYGLMNLFIIVFFATFALISMAYLIVYLAGRSRSRSRQRECYLAGPTVNQSGRIQLAGEGCGE